jgi:hypothetical protein
MTEDDLLVRDIGLVTGEVERVRRWLDWPQEEGYRLAAFDREPEHAFVLPGPSESYGILRRLDVPEQAAQEIVEALPRTREAEARWLLERCYAALISVEAPERPPWPAPWVTEDPFTRYFHLYVFLAAVRDVLTKHGARGVPEAITWATLGDVGLQVAHHHARHGSYGFDGAFWVFNHFRGELFLLGRLQYERDTADYTSAAFARGDPILDLHIPAIGPLTPEACDASLDAARTFFAEHFPETPYRYGTCESWLLDDQLAGVLSAETNIVRFQRRFTHDPGYARRGDEDTIRFNFGHLPSSLDELPRDTALQRGIVDVLERGGHWWIRRGWLEI